MTRRNTLIGLLQKIIDESPLTGEPITRMDALVRIEPHDVCRLIREGKVVCVSRGVIEELIMELSDE